MPDPGVAPTPPVPDGQRDLRDLQAGGYSADSIADYKEQTTQKLQAGKYSQADIAKYWGDAPPPAPKLTETAATNLKTAGGSPDILKDPLKFLATAVGTVADSWGAAWSPQLKVEQGKAGASLQAANKEFAAAGDTAGSADPRDMLTTAGHDLMGAAMAGGAAWSYAVAPFTALLNEKGSLDTQVHKIPIPEFGPKGWRMGGPLPEGFTGDTASMIAGFTMGGLHGEAPAVLPESIRYKAIDATHAGQINGPAGLVDHLVGDTPQTAQIKAALPTAQDFHAHAADVVGSPEPDASGHVEKNLQQIWAATGEHPADVVDKAKADPTYREELLTQDVAGEPVAPHYQAFRPPAPRPLEPAAKATEGQTQTFQNSVTTSMDILRGLENSGDGAVSPAGATGRYQIMPRTARDYGFDPVQLKDPAYNAMVARTMITDLYHRFNGNMEAIAIAYNSNPKRAAEWMTSGEGTRLEAERDPSARGGWRYTKVPDPRDESFLPLETQMYVARAREKMHYPEEGPAPEGAFPSADHTTEATQEILDEEKKGAEERGETYDENSAGAASAWTDERPVADAYEEMRANMGDELPPGPKGLSWYDQMITSFASRVQPFKALDDILKDMGALNPDREFSIRDAFAGTALSDQRFTNAANVGPQILDVANQETRTEHGGPTAKASLAKADQVGDTHDFMVWLAARRTEVLHARGVDAGFSVGAAKRIMRDAGEREKYAEAADIWDRYNDGVLDYGHASGRYSKQSIDNMKAVGAWVSFRKLMGDDASFRAPGKGFGIGNPLKRMLGSDGSVMDMLTASLDNARMVFQAADRNLATGLLIDFAERFPDFALRVGLKKVATAAAPDMDAIDSALAAFKIPEDQMDAAREAFGTLLQDREQLRGNQFSYYRDGVKEVWETGWPELAEAIRGTPPVLRGPITKVFQDIASGVRFGVVTIPDFAIRTFASHQLIQFVNTEGHPPPFLTGTVGVIRMMKMEGLLTDLRANGALGTSMEAMDKDVLYNTMNEVLGQTGVLGSVRNDISQYKEAPSALAAAKVGVQAVLTPIRLVRAMQERLDFGNRAGLYQQGLDKGMTPWKAGARAADAGINYTNGPANALVNWWASMVPFMKPSLLYAESAAKAIERNPGAYVAYATMAVTIPKVILFVLNTLADDIPAGQPGYVPDSDKYRNHENWEKTYYYITPPIMGQRFKLRMPADAGFAFGAVPEAIMQAMYDHDPMQFKDLAQAFLAEYLPPYLPPAIKPLAEVATNTRFDTWQPLVPSSLKDAASELQYTPNSSSPARAVAKLLGPPLRSVGFSNGLSPIAMDHMVQGWSGTGGKMILNAVSAVAGRPGPPTDIEDIPFVKGFFLRHPGMSGQILDDYYAEKAKFDMEAASKGVLKRDAKMGDTENDQDMAPKAWAYAQADAYINKVSQALGVQRDAIWGAYENKQYSDDNKRQHIEQITDQSLALARDATKAMKNFDGDWAKAVQKGEANGP